MRTRFLFACFLATALVSVATAQKARARQPAKAVVFAVLNDGATLEPIAYVANKKLETAIDGAQDAAILKAFHSQYFKPGTSYALVFGGAKGGTVTIKSSNPDTECMRHTAEIAAAPARAKLKGNVMALVATASIKPLGSGVRRPPTPAERAEIESLVRAEFTKEKMSAAVVRKLKYQNLTAIDVDNNKSIEFVGTFWVEPAAKTRALLFFIAEKDDNGKYRMTLTDYRLVEEKDTMSEDISNVDSGVYHELLLDTLDIDGDGTGEIFTYSPSFEGAGFNTYRRESAGKWSKIYEGANYRCAY